MKFENLEFLEEMILDCGEGNDNVEDNFSYLNEEYGDEDLIDEWGEERYEGYNELFEYLSENGSVDYESDGLKYRFELEGDLIKLTYLN